MFEPSPRVNPSPRSERSPRGRLPCKDSRKESSRVSVGGTKRRNSQEVEGSSHGHSSKKKRASPLVVWEAEEEKAEEAPLARMSSKRAASNCLRMSLHVEPYFWGSYRDTDYCSEGDSWRRGAFWHDFFLGSAAFHHSVGDGNSLEEPRTSGAVVIGDSGISALDLANESTIPAVDVAGGFVVLSVPSGRVDFELSLSLEKAELLQRLSDSRASSSKKEKALRTELVGLRRAMREAVDSFAAEKRGLKEARTGLTLRVAELSAVPAFPGDPAVLAHRCIGVAMAVLEVAYLREGSRFQVRKERRGKEIYERLVETLGTRGIHLPPRGDETL
ncbi:hypothetical protein CJ030_MR4G003061 [Morella rubra]|uniref:Uncharacterized protein n=1 Tax=Morella rubra TaxID=262757 RepID=A0A6A1VUD8_9ROSI|nr:hypothetical protein CJ030_MR4G003061 [Morella rubra]